MLQRTGWEIFGVGYHRHYAAQMTAEEVSSPFLMVAPNNYSMKLDNNIPFGVTQSPDIQNYEPPLFSRSFIKYLLV